jgi:uncharacterized integral membrane protein (TIGR00698 family)
VGIKTQITSRLPGIGLTLGLTLTAYLITHYLNFNTVLMALVLGVVFGNIIKLPEAVKTGVKFSSGLVLEVSIALMAFGINYGSLAKLGWQAVVLVAVTMTIVLLVTKLLAKKLDCPGSTGWLIGFGTAICGSAAIAALAPKIVKDKSDIGLALAVVNLYGLIGMIAIPFITAELLSDVENSILIGASLHAVGNVAGAGFAMSDAIGEMAVTIKLGRVALLTPALLLFGASFNKIENGTKKRAKLPWYLLAFILISITISFIPLPTPLLTSLKQISNFLLSMAMAAIGLKVGLRSLLTAGKKGLIFGGIIFVIELIVIVGLMLLLF